MVAGRKGSRRLRSAANRPSAASDRRSRSSRASSSPMPTARISIPVRENEPRAVLSSGLAQTTTRAPSAGRGAPPPAPPPAPITPPATPPPRHRRHRSGRGREGGAAPPGQLGDLALDPDPSQPPDPLTGQPQHGADGDRRLRGGLQRHGSGGGWGSRAAGRDGRSAHPVLDL